FLHEEPKRELKLQAMLIGEFSLFATPNEVFAITGLKLKQATLAGVCVIELANGAEGYIPPREQHQLGGYTTWPARTAGLERNAELLITDALQKARFALGDSAFSLEAQVLDAGPYYVAIKKSKPLVMWSFEDFGWGEAQSRIPWLTS